MRTIETDVENTARRISIDPKTHKVSYWYQKTAVVQVSTNGHIRLHSGGWHTHTTKTAMNQEG